MAWLALGVIVPRFDVLPAFPASNNSHVAWRYVSTDRRRKNDARFVIVKCPDGFARDKTRRPSQNGSFFHFSCLCKTAAWFHMALSLFPGAHFIGKLEDDAVVHEQRLLVELAEFSGRANHEYVWYGHFDWASHLDAAAGPTDGAFAAVGDNVMLKRTPGRSIAGHVLAPFASGGLDIRSRQLALATFGACTASRRYLQTFRPKKHHNRVGGDCDGLQGYFVVKCLSEREGPKEVVVLHLPWPKYHPSTQPRIHTVCIHPQRKAHFPAARWNKGQALLPFPFRLRNITGRVHWSAEDSAAIKSYLRLHLHREDEKYCDVLPCRRVT